MVLLKVPPPPKNLAASVGILLVKFMPAVQVTGGASIALGAAPAWLPPKWS